MRLGLFAVLAVACGCRGSKVETIEPALGLDVAAADFGAVKVGTTKAFSLPVAAATKTELELTAELMGDPAFALVAVPARIGGLTREPVELSLTATEVRAYSGELVLRSNDPQQPEVRMPLSGHGALGRLGVKPGCDRAARCEASVTDVPPTIHFAPEPFVRLAPLDARALPTLTLESLGEVPVTLNALSLGGADVAAFSFVGNASVPDGGASLLPGAAVTLSLRFRPTSDAQAAYAGEVRVGSDDPAAAALSVPLSGDLRPNAPPRVCLNLVRVARVDAPPRSWDTFADWSALTTPPSGGYDFTPTRDVPPRAEVQLSAISDAADEGACTFDPDDGRLGLTWQWRIVSAPLGSTPVPLLGATGPAVSLRPFAVGRYQVELTVSDSQGNSTVVGAAFTVALKSDLLAQLEWAGAAGVDLDLHLVRPDAGPFAFFAPTAGDLNGYAVTLADAGRDFDWGTPGPLDDPKLNADDTGSGALLENISLDGPENDARCALGPCTYEVWVHHFRDARAVASAPACTVDGGAGCRDGEACGCAAPARCVANVAPAGAAAVGAGRCLPPVSPVVRLFFKGAAVADQVVTGTLAAPCELWHAADVVWPARGTDAGIGVGVLIGPRLVRYGVRSNGSLQCAPNAMRGGAPWYAPEPL